MGNPALPPRLRGREAEVRILAEALDQAARGSLAIVLVEGEAGIGKTRLLEEALTGAAAWGMQAVAGRPEELERARPFGLLADAFGCGPASLDSRRAAIAELLAAGGGSSDHPVTVTSDPGLQFRVVDAFGDLAETLALSGPLVIGADDLQWADPSSLLTVAAMARRLPGLPVAIIGCLRPVPRSSELDGLIGALQAAGARQLTLPPLGAEAVRELTCEAVAADPGPGLLSEVSGAAGNPLFVIELLGALLQESAIQVAEGRAEVAEARLPPSLRLTILRRISFLPDDAIQLLQVASVLGSAFSLTDLALISGRPVIELTTAMTEAIRARVIGDDGIQLRFRHDLIAMPFTRISRAVSAGGCTARRRCGWRVREHPRCGLPSTSPRAHPSAMVRPLGGLPGPPANQSRGRQRSLPSCWTERSACCRRGTGTGTVTSCLPNGPAA